MNELFAGQRADGGWPPFWASDYSSLDAACYRLAQAEQLGLSGSHPFISHALRFLTQRQRPNGSWEEDPSVATIAPPWALPGDLQARLYLTANCGFWLALLDDDRDPASRAGRYLQDHLDEDGRMPTFLHTHWLAGSLWYRLNWQEAAERVMKYLAARLQDMPASNLAWLMIAFLSAGLPAGHRLIDAAASLLERLQATDGRWPSEDDPERDVHTTLEAIRALHFCRLSSSQPGH